MSVHDICHNCGKFVAMIPASGRLKCPECGALNNRRQQSTTSIERETSEGFRGRPKRRA